jgi:hypothetical protein
MAEHEYVEWWDEYFKIEKWRMFFCCDLIALG